MSGHAIYKQIQYVTEYAAGRLFSLMLLALPTRLVYVISDIIAWCAWFCLGVRKDVTMYNLRLALGDTCDEAELERIGFASYRHVAAVMAEMLLIPKLRHRIFEIVDMPDIELLRKDISKNRGIVGVSCHCGNWELNGASIAAAGVPFTAVAATQSNPYVDKYITGLRLSLGMEVVHMRASAKDLVGAMKRNRTIGLIADQDAGRNGAFVTFFGHLASTPKGPAQLALKYNSPMIAGVTVRKGYGRYRSIFREVPYDESDTVQTLTQRYTDVFEDFIREYPEQYLWMHRRWKTNPNGNGENYLDL